MNAKEFNQLYAVGTPFIYQPSKALHGGQVVKTVDIARDLKTATVVEINLEPYFVNTKSLTPAG